MEHTTSPHPGSTVTSDQPATLVVGAMIGGLVILGVVLAVLGAELLVPPTWALLLLAATTAGAWATAAMAPTGGPATTVRPGTAAADIPAADIPAGAVVPVVVLRAAVLESPALVGLVLAFLSDPMDLTVYVLPTLFAIAGLALFARPGVVRERLARQAASGTAGPTR